MSRTMTPNVLLVGSGGVGTMVAYTLAYNNKCDVSLIVRSNYETIKTHGYDIKSVAFGDFTWVPPNVYQSPEQVAHKSFDYIVLTTKNVPDGPMTCEDIIRPYVGPATTIILIQNGIDIDRPMVEAFPGRCVLSGVSLIGSTKVGVNGIHHAHKEELKLGAFKTNTVSAEHQQRVLHEFAALHQTADDRNRVIIDTDVEYSRWEKLVYNSVLNTTTAVVGLDIGRCQINGANKQIFEPAMREVLAIASSEGYVIDEHIIDKFIHLGDGLFYTPSMGVDRKKNQLMELQVILGNPLKVAAKNGVATPVLSMLYQLLTMIQFQMKESQGIISVDQSHYQNVNSDDFPEVFAKHNQ